MKKLTGNILLYGSTESCPEIRHAIGVNVPDPVIVLLRSRGLDVVASTLEYGRLVRTVKGRIWTPDRLALQDKALRSTSDWALGLLHKYRIRNIRVRSDFPLQIARKLESEGIRICCESPGLLYPFRTIKTPAEIDKISNSQRAAVAGVLEAGRMIGTSEADRHGILQFEGRPLTSERVREAIRRKVIEFGCIDSGTIVAGGSQGADPHEVGSGPLRTGEFVVVDLFPRHLETGYWGDLTRTFIHGTPSERQLAMYNAVAKAQKAALKMLRPGIDGTAVHTAVSQILAEAGFETTLRDGLPVGFFHGTGHGLGLEIHEAPTLSRISSIMEEGMVVTVEPGLYYPELGGVRIEDTVQITATGHRILARCPVETLKRS